jgi:bifunctional enzyme CysN/CysC
LLGHRGAVVWLTGLSGAGKSTLALGLEAALLEHRVLASIVDGDVLRTGLSQDLGFSKSDRQENIRRAAELAFHLAEAGGVAIVALISPHRADRERVASRAAARGVPFAEVFINAPLAICERRDPKGLYKKARAGQIASFTGIDSPYEAPLAPALELHTGREPVPQSLARLTRLALELARKG